MGLPSGIHFILGLILIFQSGTCSQNTINNIILYMHINSVRFMLSVKHFANQKRQYFTAVRPCFVYNINIYRIFIGNHNNIVFKVLLYWCFTFCRFYINGRRESFVVIYIWQIVTHWLTHPNNVICVQKLYLPIL